MQNLDRSMETRERQDRHPLRSRAAISFRPQPAGEPARGRIFTRLRRWTGRFLLGVVWLSVSHLLISSAVAQLPLAHYGETVPRDVREMYDRGLQFLTQKQTAGGNWTDGQTGPGTTGLCLMAFLASGEDPNFGIYRNNVRRALRSMISTQDKNTGYMGNSMYHHGFAMLALAEAYGAVDESDLWEGTATGEHTGIGAALELAVRTAITSQKKNPLGAWRYSPNAADADTSVSGAILVGLLAARNAGIEVPDTAIDKAVSYYKSMTSSSGQVGYSGGMGGMGESLARSSIACLVYSLAHRKDLPQYTATIQYLVRQPEASRSPYAEYTLYYQSQALFQGDVEAWEKWNKLLVRKLKATQQSDGSFPGQFGASFGTSMSLLALALNYRLLPIYERYAQGSDAHARSRNPTRQ